MMGSALRRSIGVGVAVACAALAGCDANQSADLKSVLHFSASKPAEKTPATVKPPEQTAAIPPSADLTRLHDMKAPEVEALVGSPDFRRVEPPAELWQYRTANCVVDLFFYGKDDDRRVVHEDARPRDPAGATDRRCGDGTEVLNSRLRG